MVLSPTGYTINENWSVQVRQLGNCQSINQSIKQTKNTPFLRGFVGFTPSPIGKFQFGFILSLRLSPSEFPITTLHGEGMDIFWNHTIGSWRLLWSPDPLDLDISWNCTMAIRRAWGNHWFSSKRGVGGGHACATSIFQKAHLAVELVGNNINSGGEWFKFTLAR